MSEAPTCRWCPPDPSAPGPEVVLDLGRQPASDHFPLLDDGGRGNDLDGDDLDGDDLDGDDPRWPLRMGLCPRCRLAQLVEDPGATDEPRGLEPRALVDQAHQAVAAVVAAGLAGPGRSVREFDSPHGGSWRDVLVRAGCTDRTGTTEQVDLVVDVFGLMHDPDQRAALQQRVDALAPGGTLLLQHHSLHSIVRQQQWNALRHGHTAYYATSVLADMVAGLGLTARRAWSFELYGGTVLLAADADPAPTTDPVLLDLLATDTASGVRTPAGLAGLAAAADDTARELVAWLTAHRDAGRRVIGYGVASRAVPLLVRAGVDRDLLPAVADASPAKLGRRLPGSRIPVVPADRLRTGDDDVVLLLVPDLLDEVRSAYPEVVARGGAWAISEPRPHLV